MKVFLDMVGCRLNQSEIERFARQFRSLGHTLVSTPEAADTIVINTCTVTAAADADSRGKIHHASLTAANQVVVTGCWATIFTEEARHTRGVTQVIANPDKDDLVPQILQLPASSLIQITSPRQPILGARLRTRAFIKVQDGCDNHCTYCITTLARGPGRSVPVEDVLLDIRSALDGGAQEIVLTGVHLGSWGYDFETPSHLTNLIQAILNRTGTPRLRLSSLEPWDLSPEFFDLWKDPRLCPHFHLPLQSGCGATLKRMGRRITPEIYTELVCQIRAVIPGSAITTDIITGFPGETEEEFVQSVEFVKSMEFSAGHVFTYSPRPGTAAANLPSQVPYAVAKARNATMRQIFKSASATYRQHHLGSTLQVLWEKANPVGPDQWELSGLSENYLRVHANHSSPCQNQVMKVRITSMKKDGLVGSIEQPESSILHNQDTI